MEALPSASSLGSLKFCGQEDEKSDSCHRLRETDVLTVALQWFLACALLAHRTPRFPPSLTCADLAWCDLVPWREKWLVLPPTLSPGHAIISMGPLLAQQASSLRLLWGARGCTGLCLPWVALTSCELWELA